MNVSRLSLFLVCLATGSRAALPADGPSDARGLVKTFCIECHNSTSSEAGVNFERLLVEDSFVKEFRDWQNAAGQLRQKRMPPEDADQPSMKQRENITKWIDEQISVAAKSLEGDPGHVVIRRLTSAEYGYAIRDLTGIDINVERGFVPDSVGGAGFTNTGIVQFTQDSTIETYLRVARHVADHAVIGAGPLTFFRDPGQTGFELSAIDRIQKIYREHGFRTAAGEGGEPFGLDRYTMAFFAAWKYRNRVALGEPEATLADCAKAVHLDVRFVEYIHSVVTQKKPTFPTSAIVEAWRKLPAPDPDSANESTKTVAERCQKISQLLLEWQNRFGSNADAKEEAPVLRADLFEIQRTQPFEMNINWPKGTKTAHLVLSVESANRNGKPAAVILWKDAKIQFRDYKKILQDPRPLRDFLEDETVTRLGFGKHPRGGRAQQNGFVTVGTKPPSFELPIPEGAGSARMFITAELDTERGEDSIVRCTISQLEETDQGKSVSGLLANPQGDAFEKWKAGVLEFASLLPQMSQREPAPSDRDPIPAPIDPTYNNAERNFFHTRIKYFRDDAFLVENILDDKTRRELDLAWADLRGSFDFHDSWLVLLAQKYGFELDGLTVAGLDEKWIESTPNDAQKYLRALKEDYDRTQTMARSAVSWHMLDVVQFASRAWRRPLTNAEGTELQAFYRALRSKSRLGHRSALCAVLARVLVSPSFLYRAERSTDGDSKNVRPLTQAELASRLSFLLWSSIPDDELSLAATANELSTREQLAAQTQRMLKDSRARRFADEFFGQWFGFYRFGQFRGVDPEQFPEFSDSLREAMHSEAVEFFDFVVRNDRPVNEILFADYAFLNSELAAHYGIKVAGLEKMKLTRVENANRLHRGGLLRLGSVLATTSAPRRTSPVRRGDWILRRVLGTPVPPPPADAGSIAADEVVADGLSIRKRLEAHRRDASCHNCHARFDAFGFALENYDPLGRWRNQYRDSKPVETVGVLRGGEEIVGDEGLHRYLSSQEHLFHETLARRLLGYALGRRELVGDLALLTRLTDDMKSGAGLSRLLVRIVTSRQFRYHRGSFPPSPAPRIPPENE
jgi:hypothetical protein